MPPEHVDILLRYCKLVNEPRDDEKKKSTEKHTSKESLPSRTNI
jgi:hypothetical protein